MSKRKPSSCSIGLLLLLVLISIAGVLIFGAFFYLPSQAEAIYGPPDPGIKKTRQVFYAILLLVQQKDLTQPTDANGERTPFQIASSESTPSVVGRLWEQGLISNPGAFSTYLQYTGLDRSLQAGDYELSPAMSPIAIAHTLQDATPTKVTFHILAGWRLEEIAASLKTSGLSIQPDEFLSAARSIPAGYSFSVDLPEQASLEGFMLPGAYTVPRNTSIQYLLAILCQAFDQQVNEEIRQGFQRQGLSLYQGVTLASIVQKESMQTDEMPMIASVFYNRLSSGMKLDTDPTVQYALGFNQGTWWTNPLGLEDLKIDSPYNTYLYPGLPPGPIAAPSLEALHAVAFPAQTPYYYFRAACDGSGRHLFSQTFEEHLQKECP